MNDYVVYKHTAPNGKVYIGITSINVKQRWKNGYKHNAHFQAAILKYGWNNIKHEILYSDLTKEEAEQKEIELIAKYKSNQREFGYNKSLGGESHDGCKVSEESRRKMSEAHKGKKQSEETIEKRRKSMIGKHWKCSDEARYNMSLAKKGKPSSKALIIKGKTLEQWSKETGIKYSTLYSRIFTYKWPLEKALQKG